MSSPGSRGELRQLLATDRQNALSEVRTMDADTLLAENVDLLVAEFSNKIRRDPVALHWDRITRTAVRESNIVSPGSFGGTVRVPAQQVTLTVPLTGDHVLLEYRATQGYMSVIDGDITSTSVSFGMMHTEITPEAVSQSLQQWRGYYDNLTTWANEQFRVHMHGVEGELRSAIDARRARLLRDRELDASLDIPIADVEDAPTAPVPMARRVVRLEERRARQAFVPEPILDDAHFEDILKQCQSWARGLERTPSVAAKMDEEELRDHLLITLNTHWQGQAGAELFNGAGKTDILIRERDRNVFIAECKVWRGEKAASAAVDQLLSYLVWRDSKAALIVFIRNQRVAEAIGHLHDAVAGHPQCQSTMGGGVPSQRVDYLLRADEEGRVVHLAVLPVALPPKSKAADED